MKPITATPGNLLDLQKMDPKQVIHAFKVFRVKQKGIGQPPLQDRNKLRYKLRRGGVVKQRACNTSPREECGVGLHVATMHWIQDFWTKHERGETLQVWKVAFQPYDIGSVPFVTRPAYKKDENGRTVRDAGNRAVILSFIDEPRGKLRVTKFALVHRVNWNGRAIRS